MSVVGRIDGQLVGYIGWGWWVPGCLHPSGSLWSPWRCPATQGTPPLSMSAAVVPVPHGRAVVGRCTLPPGKAKVYFPDLVYDRLSDRFIGLTGLCVSGCRQSVTPGLRDPDTQPRVMSLVPGWPTCRRWVRIRPGFDVFYDQNCPESVQNRSPWLNSTLGWQFSECSVGRCSVVVWSLLVGVGRCPIGVVRRVHTAVGRVRCRFCTVYTLLTVTARQ